MDRPIRLVENRVWRVYTGGKLLDAFVGKRECRDGHFPEEWVGSTTAAANEGREHLKTEGLSRCLLPDGSTRLLTDLIKENPTAFLGGKHLDRFGADPALLVKLLDSSVRLPVQAHPDRAFAARRLNSPFGKTESWLVLGGRQIDGPPHVYFGFKNDVGRADFFERYRAQDVPAMLASLSRLDVNPGDVFIIPGGLPHAIGGGVFLLELQEPTDFAFLLDRKGPCWDLTPRQVHMGLGDELMFDCFDFNGPGGEELLRRCRFHRDLDKPGVTPLFPDWVSEYFDARLIVGDRELTREIDSMVIGLCLGGRGAVRSKGGELDITAGRTFVVPAAAAEVEYAPLDSTLRIIEALPPRP